MDKFQQFLTMAGDAIVISDISGVITGWNPAAERLFGYTPTEALGSSLDIIIPERYRERHWDSYCHTMQTGQTKYSTSILRVPSLKQGGDTLSIAFTVALLFDECGNPEFIVAVIRDETSRFNEERLLRKKLAAVQIDLDKLME
ncbi:PAS domain-containing protein [Citrobacter braakii]|uniref:Histidine kinase n=1 Tax=Citrobacter braakii TaxID=57706 RepID=A0A1V8NTC0_CITBR|nr:PAS domain S-box protein [Citrobacter braakii]EBW7151977.1 PAS domain S-box protein [Salmonella enterica subsp. enterica serovar Coeln]OQM39643.1 histidine kinase [Citrobacter braakii]QXC16689.1 PAS domain S-box protein [Citrobacter braakii]